MKNKLKSLLLGTALAIAPLTNCEKAIYIPEIDWGNNIEFDVPKIEYEDRNIEGVLKWVSDNIEYRSDFQLYSTLEYWATPEETFKKKAGDCEDFAILDLYLLKRDLDIEGKLVIGISKYSYNYQGHAWLEIDGQYFDGLSGESSEFPNYDIDSELSYEEVMRKIVEPRRKGLDNIIVD